MVVNSPDSNDAHYYQFLFSAWEFQDKFELFQEATSGSGLPLDQIKHWIDDIRQAEALALSGSDGIISCSKS